MIRIGTFAATIAALLPALLGAQPSVDVRRYTAEIAIDPAARHLGGAVDVALAASGGPLSTIPLMLRDLAVTLVRVDGADASYAQHDGMLDVDLATPLAEGDSAVVHVEYGGTPTDEGGSAPWGGCFWNLAGTSFSMGVGFAAPEVSMTRHWLPCNDVPWDKATFDLTYVVPDGYAAAGSGLLRAVESRPNGVAYRWVEEYPTATYLVTYAVSAYAVVRDTAQGLPLEYFVPKADSLHAVAHFAPVPAMLAAFTAVYGAYPFEKVGYCVTPFGSMEHETMISYDASVFHGATVGSTAAHELSHQWWGDCVTPRDFREAWLSEGFATFSEAVYAGWTGGRSAYEAAIRSDISEYRSRISITEGMFPLYDFPRTPPSSNYPETIYRKGACVLAMLRHMLDDDSFFRGLRDYLDGHRYGSATTEDLRASMERVAGIPLDWYFDEWVYRPGFPVYEAGPIVDTTVAHLRYRIRQLQDTTRVPLFRMPLDIDIHLSNGDTIHTTVENDAVVQQDFDFPSIPAADVTDVDVDPSSLVLKKLSYRTVDVRPVPSVPGHGLLLYPSFPNPAVRGGSIVVPFLLRDPAHVRFDVYDTLGRAVTAAADATFDAGRHELHIPSTALPRGVYRVMGSTGGASSLSTFSILD